MGTNNFFVLAFWVLIVIFVVEEVKVEADYRLYEGNWELDYSYPYYSSRDCPFIEKQFDCEKNGRPDTQYQKYRFQSYGNVLERFNGQDFLRRTAGKRIMFIGDSLSLNQWQSLACLLHTTAPHANYTLTRQGGLSTFVIPEYKVTLLLSRNAFLVDLVTENNLRILKINSISSGSLWLTADILIFDSWHWWLHRGRKQPWDFIDDGSTRIADMDRYFLYERALTTWVRWLNGNVNENKTRVFFQGVSPDHDDGRAWNAPGETCTGQQAPVPGPFYPGGANFADGILQRALSLALVKKQVELLDIARLSQLRKDGHPSIYGFGGHRFADCTHWCLPGVPDTWNEFLYAAIKAR